MPVGVEIARRWKDLGPRGAGGGTIWVQNSVEPLFIAFGPDGDVVATRGRRGGLRGGPLWLRVAPDGDAREVRRPDRFHPYRFTAGRIWGVLRDDLDVASVAWIAVP